MNPHPPSARRQRAAAAVAARSAANFSDAALAAILTIWTPTYLNGYPLDRNYDIRPT